jgi:hypothetical protein
MHSELMLRALRVIEDHDPDGGEIEPTEAAYAAHQAWAIEAFGPKVWAIYAAGGWADSAGRL